MPTFCCHNPAYTLSCTLLVLALSTGGAGRGDTTLKWRKAPQARQLGPRSRARARSAGARRVTPELRASGVQADRASGWVADVQASASSALDQLAKEARGYCYPSSDRRFVSRKTLHYNIAKHRCTCAVHVSAAALQARQTNVAHGVAVPDSILSFRPAILSTK